MFYLMNIHIQPRTIYLTRHGQSEDNLDDRIGGDSNLTPLGSLYGRALAEFIPTQPGLDDSHNLNIWTSTLRRAVNTSELLSQRYKVVRKRVLNEIYAGECEGMTYKVRYFNYIMININMISI